MTPGQADGVPATDLAGQRGVIHCQQPDVMRDLAALSADIWEPLTHRPTFVGKWGVVYCQPLQQPAFTIARDLAALQKQVQARGDDIRELRSAIVARGADIRELRSAIVARGADIRELRSVNDAKSANIRELHADIREMRSANDAQGADIRELHADIRELGGRVHALEMRAHLADRDIDPGAAVSKICAQL